jgi:WD40 repeat protein
MRRILIQSIVLVICLQGPTVRCQPPAKLDREGEPLPSGAIARMGTARLHYGNPLGPVVFTSDSKTLAVVVRKQESLRLLLSNAATGKVIREIKLAHLAVRSILFTPDDRFFALLSAAGEVEIISVTTGKTVRELDTDRWRVSSIALSPDGKILAGGCSGFLDQPNVIQLWDFATEKRLHVLDGHQTPVQSVAFSADGKRLLSASYDVKGTPGTRVPRLLHGTICIWDMPSGKLRKQIHQVGEHNLFSSDGKTMAYWDKDQDIHLFDIETEKEIARLPVKNSTFLFLPDGKSLATASEQEMIILWHARTGRKLRQFRGYRGSEGHLTTVSPDGKVLVSSRLQAIRLWDVARGEPLLSPAGHFDEVTCLAFSSDRKTVLSGSKDQTVRLWEARTGKTLHSFDRHQSPVSAVAFSPDGTTAATGDLANNIHLWETATGKLLHRLEPQPSKEPAIERGIQCLAFSRDGKSLTAGSTVTIDFFGTLIRTGTLSQWDTLTGKILGSVKEENGNPVALSSDGKFSATLSFTCEDLFKVQSELIVRRVGSERVVCRMKAELNEMGEQVVFSPDGTSLALSSRISAAGFFGGGRDTHLYRLLDVASGEVILKKQIRFDSLCFSPDGKVLATLDMKEGTSIRLVDPLTAEALGKLAGHLGRVNCIAFSGDGKLMASGGADQQVLVWDTTTPAFRAKRVEAGNQDLDQLWADLAGEAARGYRAVRALDANPSRSVPFLRERLRPVAPVPAATIAKAIEDLESKNFRERRKAIAALEKLGDLAEPALRQVLKENPSLELSRHVRALLDKVEQGDSLPERLRESRAITVLERAGTRGARQLLLELSKGAPGARLTEDARAALERLSRVK